MAGPVNPPPPSAPKPLIARLALRLRQRRALAGWALAALAAGALAAPVAGALLHETLVARFADETLADARLRQALADSEVARLRLLPEALANDRDVTDVAQPASSPASGAPSPDRIARLNARLERMAREAGAAVIYLIGPDGRALAASNWRSPTTFLGKYYGFRPYYREARDRGQAEQFALGTVSGKPGLYLGRRVNANNVIVVKLEFDGLEAQWRAAGGLTFVTDRDGVILVTSRPDWRFAATHALDPATHRAETRTNGVPHIGPPPFHLRNDGTLVLTPSAPLPLLSPAEDRGPYLLASTPPDARGWRFHLALPLREVETTVTMARIGGGLIAAVLVALAGLLAERRRRRAERTRQLEDAVAERTAAMGREMAERMAAEERAETLRETLRQANRLATLGQITAGVAHETAQPVAAIRTHAMAARLLLDRGETAQAAQTLVAIDGLADRIGTVTAQLRNFARKGRGGSGPVAMAEIIDGACLLLKERLAPVTFACPPVPPGLHVQGERVRFEQVLVNLMRNALEAMEGSPDPVLTLTLIEHGDMVTILIADNGPGIAPDLAERLFTPFATTRPAGLGLGLVIARDIVEELGGTLQLRPGRGGATFAVTLPRARP